MTILGLREFLEAAPELEAGDRGTADDDVTLIPLTCASMRWTAQILRNSSILSYVVLRRLAA